MARNGSGVYSLPAGSTVTNGDTSDATDLNTPLADIEADLNLARPVVAGGTGATSAGAARTNLAVPGLADNNTFTGDNTFQGSDTFADLTATTVDINGGTLDNVDITLGDNRKITWSSGSGGDTVRWSTGNGFIGEENGAVTFRLGPTPFIEGVGTNTTANGANVNVTTAGTLARSTSSGAYKINRVPLSDVGAFVDGLNPLSFESTHENDNGRRFIGFIAEEVSALVPEASVEGGQNYDLRAIVAILAAEVKSLRARVAALEV